MLISTAPIPKDIAIAASGRVEGFDLLRGICAIAVAYYHLLSWTDAALFESWGRYGVYTFFVLSGASMYIAYNRKFEQGYDVGKFIALRFFRLAPLFALVLAADVAYSILRGKSASEALSLAFLNITFAFGFGNPGDTSVVIGGWSLGIEFIFYLIFPVMLALIRGRYWAFFVAGAFVVQHIFINHVLAGETLTSAWVPYTQMLSFVFYFVAGCGIGRAVQTGLTRSSLLWVAVFAVAALPLIVVHGEGNLVGWTGMSLSLCAVALVFASAGLPLSGNASWVTDYLGKMSYGVYLIHPAVYLVAKTPLAGQDKFLMSTIIVAISAVLAILAEKYFEEPVRRKAQALLNR